MNKYFLKILFFSLFCSNFLFSKGHVVSLEINKKNYLMQKDVDKLVFFEKMLYNIAFIIKKIRVVKKYSNKEMRELHHIVFKTIKDIEFSLHTNKKELDKIIYNECKKLRQILKQLNVILFVDNLSKSLKNSRDILLSVIAHKLKKVKRFFQKLIPLRAGPYAPGVIHVDDFGTASIALIEDSDIDASAAISDTKLATISTAGKVLNSATTATNTNVVDTLVLRDSSGDFSAGIITADLSGNAATATIATTATTATTAGNFSGSLAGDVTGNQSATVVSLVGGQSAANVAAATVLANAATSANTANAIVKRNSSGNFITNMITINGTVTNATDVATKAYVDSVAGGVSTNTPNTLVLRDNTGSFSAQTISVVDEVLSGNLSLSDSTSSTVGSIVKNGTRFIHNFGTNNTFVGKSAGNFTTSGSGGNTALGVSALTANTTGTANTAVGNSALSTNTTGSNNTVIGANAFSSGTGSSNIVIGQNAGSSSTLATSSNNVYIANAGANESGTIRIGTNGTHSTCFIQGISGNTLIGSAVSISASGQLGVVLSSHKFKHTIAKLDDAVSKNVLKLEPVSFIYNDDKTNTIQIGLLAEEVEKIFPPLVVKDEEGLPYSVRYDVLPVLMLHEMKKQREDLDRQNKMIMDLQQEVSFLRHKITDDNEKLS